MDLLTSLYRDSLDPGYAASGKHRTRWAKMAISRKISGPSREIGRFPASRPVPSPSRPPRPIFHGSLVGTGCHSQGGITAR